jgi:hypothetical protein
MAPRDREHEGSTLTPPSPTRVTLSFSRPRQGKKRPSTGAGYTKHVRYSNDLESRYLRPSQLSNNQTKNAQERDKEEEEYRSALLLDFQVCERGHWVVRLSVLSIVSAKGCQHGNTPMLLSRPRIEIQAFFVWGFLFFILMRDTGGSCSALNARAVVI